MIGTTFPASIIGNRAGPRGKVDDRHHLPAVDRHGRHDSAPRAPASRRRSSATGPRPLPPVALDDRHQLPGVDRHDGHDRGRCEPWPWMIGTTFPPSIIGNRAGPRGKVDDRQQLPAVDRHGRHDGGRCHPWPWMIGTTGTSFPVVEARHDVPGCRSARRAPRAPLPPVALDDRHQLPGCRGAATGQDRGKVDDRHGRHGHRAARSMIGTTFPASIIGNRAGPRGKVDDRHQLPAVDRHGRHDSAPRARRSRLSIGTTGTTGTVATRGPG